VKNNQPSHPNSHFVHSESLLLSVIIVSYNTKELTLAACHSVLSAVAQSKTLREQTELIVVDNNSSDGSAAALKTLQKEKRHSHKISVITSPSNDGFAVANNRAFRESRGKYLLLLNSDTELHPHALEHLIDTMESMESQADADGLRTLGILAASLVNADGTPQPQGGSLPSLLSVAAQYLFLDDLPIIGKLIPSTQHTGRNLRAAAAHEQDRSQPEVLPMGWVGGTAMLVRRAVCAQVGLLDENIFMYGEDMEFCQRAANHHFSAAIEPRAQVTHYQNASGSSEHAIIGEIKGYQHIWAKHKPIWESHVLNAILFFGALARMIIFDTIKRDHKRARIYKNALSRL
jgi:GT2 family glycosyltransferase